MKSGNSKVPAKKNRHRQAAGQQSSTGQNIERQHQELLQLRKKVRSLTKDTVGSRRQSNPKIATESYTDDAAPMIRQY
jgi:hypothetical protein